MTRPDVSAIAWVEGFSAGSLDFEKNEQIRSLDPAAYDRGYDVGQTRKGRRSYKVEQDEAERFAHGGNLIGAVRDAGKVI